MSDVWIKGPLTIFVMWHPDFSEGAELATAVHDGFRMLNGHYTQHGSEIPVYYRSQPWTKTVSLPAVAAHAAPGAGHPVAKADDDPCSPAGFRPFAFADAALNVVVALVDPHMVNDENWRASLLKLGKLHWADEKSKKGDSGVLLVPVELTRGLAALAPEVSAINAVRVDAWRDGKERPETAAERLERRKVRLVRYLTQTLVRVLRERVGRGGEGPQARDAPGLLSRSVFISHAKGDGEAGVGIAEAIKAHASTVGQLDVFMDATDLNWGTDWYDPMLGAAGRRTAAFVAVMSDLYASRDWCREEARRARTPRSVRLLLDPTNALAPTDEADARIWWVQPAVAIDNLAARWSRLVPELSGIPVIRWQDPDQTPLAVLDRLMHDALQAHVHVDYARSVDASARRRSMPGVKADRVHYLTWTPEPTTLLEWAHPEAESPPIPQGTPENSELTLVVYPGHGMLLDEESQLGRYFGKQVRFVSLDEFVDALIMESALPNDTHPTPATWLGLAMVSAGTVDPVDLNALGCGPEHLQEGVFRIVRACLRSRLRIGYGGALDVRSGLLEPMLDAAAASDPTSFAHRTATPQGATHAPLRPIESFQAWPHCEATTPAREAELHSRCKVHRVLPPGWGADELAKERKRRADPTQVSHPGRDAFFGAEALSSSRILIAKSCDLLISMGGAVTGFSGWCPGILEEAAAMAATDRPVLPLAIYGGAARRLVAWILTNDQSPGSHPRLELCELEYILKADGNDKLRLVMEGARDELGGPRQARQHAEHRLASIQANLVKLRAQIRTAIVGGGDYHGLPGAHLRRAMTADSVRTIRRVIATQVVPCWGARPT
jgi:SLOG cluster2/TIR domain